MKFFLAGIPESLANFLLDKLTREIPDQQFAEVPARDSNCYIVETPKLYAQKFTDEISTVVRGDDKKGVLGAQLFCVLSFWRQVDKPLIKNLFPSIPIICFEEPEFEWVNEKRKRELVNTYVKKIREEFPLIKKFVKRISREVEKTNSSPFLLPLRHFRCQHLYQDIYELFYTRRGNIRSLDPYQILKELRVKTKLWKDENNRNCFVDSGNVRYITPGSAKHGGGHKAVDDDPEHIELCYLNSNFRLGHPIDSGFHFDCRNKDKSKISGAFEGCHGQQILAYNKAYVNIYPNNHVRPPTSK